MALHIIRRTKVRTASGGGDRSAPYSCVVSIDTLEIFSRSLALPKGIREGLAAAHRGRILIYEVRAKNRLQGYRIALNAPIALLAFLELDRMQERLRAVVSRVHLAADFVPEARADIERHCVLRWRRSGEMHEFDPDEGGGLSWSHIPKGSRRPNRNLVLYDRASKITNQACTHLELRLERSFVCQRENIFRVRDLFELNPRQLFDKHVGWCDLADTSEQDAVRRTVADNRERHTKLNRPFDQHTDRYRSSIANRVRALRAKAGLHRSQAVHDARKRRKAKPRRSDRLSDHLVIPDALTWAG